MVLASTSAARAALLRAAGVAFTARAPDVEESEFHARLEADGATPAELSLALAEAKAVGVNAPDAAVIGADQVLDLEGACVHKAASLAQARRHLEALRGRSHRLHSAVVLARNGAVVWRHVDSARLTMRAFSDAYLAAYLERHGERLLASVGGYRLEDDGVQLFTAVEGDYFTILGMPLVPLLEALREHGALAS